MPIADSDRLAATADKLRQLIDADKGWAEPKEIKSDLRPAPEFDGPTLLPPALCNFVLDEADRMLWAPVRSCLKSAGLKMLMV